ncbi:MAG TPA: class I SAM-dependent methyltransferase [Glycomyces sp.]|nr:class I SAM-dependent methyltransferase [Glycomyces sp.]
MADPKEDRRAEKEPGHGPRTAAPRFGKDYWERHWTGAANGGHAPVNPHVRTETAGLAAGTALDAGCGRGTEAIWLAERGWRVTGADISATALAAAARRAERAGLAGAAEWIEADLTVWEPGRTWDLVTTAYAHPETGQLAFYERVGSWVAPGGTLLVVAHLHDSGHEDAEAAPAAMAALFTGPRWRIGACYERARTVVRPDGRPVPLRDAVVRAHRSR